MRYSRNEVNNLVDETSIFSGKRKQIGLVKSMAQRHSGRERIELDRYDTPDWVIQQVIPYLPKRAQRIWEPAGGRGQVGMNLMARGFDVVMSDIKPRHPAVMEMDFLKVTDPDAIGMQFDGIFTNPPFNVTGVKFVEQALRLTEQRQGWCMFLFGSEWDTASRRPHLLDACPQYVGKFIHQERIVWFDPDDPEAMADRDQVDLEELLGKQLQPKEPKKTKNRKTPSSNHAWFYWDWRNRQGWKPRTWWIPKREDIGKPISERIDARSRVRPKPDRNVKKKRPSREAAE